MTLIRPEINDFEALSHSSIEGFFVREECLPPASDAAFPDEAAGSEPATEARTARDYFAIQFGLFVDGVPLGQEIRQQVASDYVAYLSHAARKAYKEELEAGSSQKSAYLRALDFIGTDLEAIKQQTSLAHADEKTGTKQQTTLIFKLGAKYYRESAAGYQASGTTPHLDEGQIAVLLRDVSMTGTARLFGDAVAARQQQQESAVKSMPATKESGHHTQQKKGGILLAAKAALIGYMHA